MATKPRKTAARKPHDVEERLIAAALDLAAARGWRSLSLLEIAQAAGEPLAKIYPVASSKGELLDLFARRIDAAVLSEEEPEEEFAGTSPRDRLFDVMMRRFDALQPHKAAIGNIVYDQLRDPAAALGSLPQLARSMRWMLEAAGIDGSGLAGAARVQGLIGIYLASLRVWLGDDSPDMTKTMAALDGYLRRIEALAGRLSRPAKRDAGAPAEPVE